MEPEYGSQEEINNTAADLMHDHQKKYINEPIDAAGIISHLRRFGYKIIRVGDGHKDYQV